MPSQDFQDFVRSCFPKTYGDWHDGLNFHALLKLHGDELLEAEKLILKGIPKTWSTNHTIEAAGYLRLQSASEILKREIKVTRIKRFIKLLFLFLLYPIWREHYHERLAVIAWALYQIEKYPKSLDIIINELEDSKNQEFFSFTVLAFRYLISFGDEPKTIEFLNKCTKHKNFSFSAFYALEAIQDGNRLPFNGDYSQKASKKLLALQEHKTWEWL